MKKQNKNWEEALLKLIWVDVDEWPKLKDFIRQNFISKEELREKIKGMKKSEDKKDHFIPGKPGATHRAKRAVGYNQALSDLLKELGL